MKYPYDNLWCTLISAEKNNFWSLQCHYLTPWKIPYHQHHLNKPLHQWNLPCPHIYANDVKLLPPFFLTSGMKWLWPCLYNHIYIMEAIPWSHPSVVLLTSHTPKYVHGHITAMRWGGNLTNKKSKGKGNQKETRRAYQEPWHFTCARRYTEVHK